MFAVIEHATAHPTAAWPAQLGRNLVLDLEDASAKAKFLIRDRDAKFTDAFDAVLDDAGLEVVQSGVRMPRINSITERWIQTCRRELLDRILIWNQRHLLHTLREYETFYNRHRHPRAGPGRTSPAPPGPWAGLVKWRKRADRRNTVRASPGRARGHARAQRVRLAAVAGPGCMCCLPGRRSDRA